MNIPQVSTFRNPRDKAQILVCISCTEIEHVLDPVDKDDFIHPAVWSVHDPVADRTLKYGYAYGYGGGLGSMIDANKKARKWASDYFRRLNKKTLLTK